MTLSRRAFLQRVGAAAAWSSPARIFPRAAAPSTGEFRGIGYASITWGGRDGEAIAEIAEAGYGGIQLRSNILKEWEPRPRALAEELGRHHLTFVALSSGNVAIEPGSEADEIATHVGHAKFVKACGGLYLQVLDQRPKRPLVAADYRRLVQLLTEIGKRTSDLSIPLGYHNHMNSMGERPEEVDRILESSDPRHVKLELDVAHYLQGGGDPVKAIRKYGDRLLFMHIKDVESPVPGATGDLSGSYRWVELGRGKVDLKGVFAALRDLKFSGWIIVELDSVPDKARTPKEAALVNKRYLEQVIGLHVGA
jgi:inosose dehydratase